MLLLSLPRKCGFLCLSTILLPLQTAAELDLVNLLHAVLSEIRSRVPLCAQYFDKPFVQTTDSSVPFLELIARRIDFAYYQDFEAFQEDINKVKQKQHSCVYVFQLCKAATGVFDRNSEPYRVAVQLYDETTKTIAACKDFLTKQQMLLSATVNS